MNPGQKVRSRPLKCYGAPARIRYTLPELVPHQKLYFEPGDSKVIGLPAINIMSFLSAHNTNSAPKRLRDKRIAGVARRVAIWYQISPLRVGFNRVG
jgi:hypothetical protein